jgi:hypothetical protein
MPTADCGLRTAGQLQAPVVSRRNRPARKSPQSAVRSPQPF